MNITKQNFIGDLVAHDYRTAEVFSNYGIDFCCKGNLSIADVCIQNNIDADHLIKDLHEIKNSIGNMALDYQGWPIDLLADYIEKKHHRYVESKTPLIKEYLNKVCRVHGSNYPELFEITAEFNESSASLSAHMKKEELIVFPYVRKLAVAQDADLLTTEFGSVENPIHMMRNEHEVEGDRFRKIAMLSNNYTPPDDACNTFRVTYSLLREFEQDLHLHIHLENNILFPRSIEMETILNSSSYNIQTT